MNLDDIARTAYPWLKAFHVIAVIAWMAGIFYLPRLFVYHAGSSIGSEKSETFKVMEQRLLTAIMTPAMIAAWVFGLSLVLAADRIGMISLSDHWLMTKLGLVVLMTLFQAWLAARAHDFLRDKNRVSARTYRIANELPTLFVIAIVILVIIKPTF
jgi:putative membrane protein